MSPKLGEGRVRKPGIGNGVRRGLRLIAALAGAELASPHSPWQRLCNPDRAEIASALVWMNWYATHNIARRSTLELAARPLRRNRRLPKPQLEQLAAF